MKIRLNSKVKCCVHLPLAAGAIIMLIPLAWMLLTSLKSFAEVVADPPVWIPREFRWSNYVHALTSFNFARFFANSALIALLNITGTILSTSMAGYAFARLRAPGKGVLFMVFLSTIMLPPQITIIPLFWIYNQLGWINTFLPLFVPSWLGINVFAIFLFRQFFLTIPQDYTDAARIDGAHEWTILFRLFLPLSKPAILTVAVLTFIGSWNDLWNPLIFIHKEALYTLPVALVSFLQTTHQAQGTQWHLMMAASAVVVLPIIILFFFAQRYFIEGITFSGIKA